MAPSKTTTKPAASSLLNNRGTVRFHEEVRVKKIQANGKNRSLYEVDPEDGDHGFGEDDTLDWEEEADGGDKGGGEGFDQEMDEYPTDEYESEGEDSEGEGEETGREAIERLKDDLFAEEDENSEQLGQPLLFSRSTLTYVFPLNRSVGL
jgi:U3 small nucleolar RNA-associated protein MPP10